MYNSVAAITFVWLFVCGMSGLCAADSDELLVARVAAMSAVDLRLVTVSPAEDDGFPQLCWLRGRAEDVKDVASGVTANSDSYVLINDMLMKTEDTATRNVLLKKLFIADGLLALRDVGVSRHAGVKDSVAIQIAEIHKQLIDRRNLVTGFAAFSSSEHVLTVLFCIQIQAELDCIRVLSADDTKAIGSIISSIGTEDATDFQIWLQTAMKSLDPRFFPDEFFDEAAAARVSWRLAERMRRYTIGLAILLNARGDASTWKTNCQAAAEAVCNAIAKRLFGEAEIREFVFGNEAGFEAFKGTDVLSPETIFHGDVWRRMNDESRCRLALVLLCTPQGGQFLVQPSIPGQLGWSTSELESIMQSYPSIDFNPHDGQGRYMFKNVLVKPAIPADDQKPLGVYLINVLSPSSVNGKVDEVIRKNRVEFEKAWRLPI